MRIFVNTIIGIILIIQFIAGVLNSCTMSKPETFTEKIVADFIIISCFCSVTIVIVFFLMYNRTCKCIKGKTVNIIIMFFVLYATYVHLAQIFIQHDFIWSSCILLLIDCYVMGKSIAITVKPFQSSRV